MHRNTNVHRAVSEQSELLDSESDDTRNNNGISEIVTETAACAVKKVMSAHAHIAYDDDKEKADASRAKGPTAIEKLFVCTLEAGRASHRFWPPPPRRR